MARILLGIARISIFIVTFQIICPAFLIAQTNPPDTYLDYSIGGARWLMSKAVQDGSSFKWPEYDGNSSYLTSLYDGTPGICQILFALAKETGNDTLMNFATKGAQWLFDLAYAEGNGFKWPAARETLNFQPGLYTGTAGIGDRFLEYYRDSQDTIYRRYGLGAASWVAANDDNFLFSGIDIISGAAGQGLFMIRAYREYPDPEYLRFARKAGDWLAANAISTGSGFKWEIMPGYNRVFTGFAHGAAGAGYFLAELYKLTQDTVYLHYAVGAARWLMDVAVPVADGCKWWWEEADRSAFSTGWCHGPAGTCLLFIKLYEITGNEIFLNQAKKGANWLIDSSIPAGNGLKWKQWESNEAFDVTMCHGAAGIGEFFYELSIAAKDAKYLAYAQKAADWLLDVAQSEGNGYKWATYGYFNTGYSAGTAGISLFLLKLHRAVSSVVQEQEISSPFKIFPNPVISRLYLESIPTFSEIEIISPLGVSVLKCQYNYSIDVSSLPPGVYFIRYGNRMSKFLKL